MTEDKSNSGAPCIVLANLQAFWGSLHNENAKSYLTQVATEKHRSCDVGPRLSRTEIPQGGNTSSAFENPDS